MSPARTRIPPAVRRSTGFTLLELLVAIAIFGVLATMAYTGLAQLSRSSSGAREVLDRLQAQRRWMAQLEADLDQVVARPGRGPYGEAQAALVGSDSQLAYTTRRVVAEADGLGSRLERVELLRQGDQLLRRRYLRLDPGPLAEREDRILIEGVRRLEWRYLDARLETQRQWPRIADPRLDGLPRALELVLEVDGVGSVRRVFALPEVADDARL